MIRNSKFSHQASAACKLGKLFVAAAISAAAVVPAQAAIIDFEKLLGPVGHNQTMLEEGYRLTGWANLLTAVETDLVGAVLDGSDLETCVSRTCPTNNTTHYYAGLNDGLLSVQSPGVVGTVKLSSFQASYIGDNALSYPSVAGLIRVQGWRPNGTSLSQTFNLAGPTTGSFKFAQFTMASAFATTSFAEIAFFGFTCAASGSCSAFSTDRGQFALDNLNVTAMVDLPEPATGLLLGLGLIGVAASARRRRQA